MGAFPAREDDILPYIGWVEIATAKLQFAAMLGQTDMHFSCSDDPSRDKKPKDDFCKCIAIDPEGSRA